MLHEYLAIGFHIFQLQNAIHINDPIPYSDDGIRVYKWAHAPHTVSELVLESASRQSLHRVSLPRTAPAIHRVIYSFNFIRTEDILKKLTIEKLLF